MVKQRKNIVFEATYLGVVGIHTDFIVCESERLAKDYAEKEAKAYGVSLSGFERVTPAEIKHGKDYSVVEL